MTLIAREIEKYGRPKLTAREIQNVLYGCAVWSISMIPVPAPSTSAKRITADLHGTGVRTQRGDVHQDREGDHPVVHGINNVAAIELEERPTLATRATWVDYKTYQQAISQPLIQDEHKIGNDVNGLGGNLELVPERTRGYSAVETGEVPVIDVGNRLNVEAQRSADRHKGEYGSSVGH